MHKCHPSIGLLPMGEPDTAWVAQLLELMGAGRPSRPSGPLFDDDNRERSELIAKTASKILQAMIFHEATADRHVITHRYQSSPEHRIRLAGPIFSRNVDDTVTAETILPTLVNYAMKIRRTGPLTGYRLANTPPPNHVLTQGLFHPVNLIYVAAGRAGIKVAADYGVTVKEGTARLPWYEAQPTAIGLNLDLPISVVEALPGTRLSDLIELPPTLNDYQRETWEALTVATAKPKLSPSSNQKILIELQPIWEFMREDKPMLTDKHRTRTWHELAEIAHLI